MEIDREIANMRGTTALPRKNGELIFSEPWEGRVFGMAITLHEHWLAAFEKLLLDKGIITREEFERRIAEFASGEREEVF
jgi:hypothetical protein